ncbi:MAG: hypothetical protein EPN40_08040 [Rhodanobacteraceae bacterium]|nr:MAG: hypothetical protein EPN40_08040 [Rhodanobacteraceae bacterium]
MSETTPGRKRWRWLRREAIDLGDLLVQIIAVVVGILLALLINDWVTQRQQQANIDEAMRAIRAELTQNRVVVRHFAAHMYRMAAEMQDSPKNRGKPAQACYSWNQWDGIGGMVPLDAAYQTSIATQALANMPFQQAQVVSRIYGWQHYASKGIELDTALLMQPHPLDFCVGLVQEVGRDAMQLDDLYSKLIGPETATRPKPPASPSGQ